MRLSIAEILNKIPEITSKKEKVDWLKKNDSPALRTVLKYMYDPNLKTLLPEGAPPFESGDFPDGQGMLYSEAKRLRIFYQGFGYDNLNKVKRERLFIDLLETVMPEDAKLLIDMKDKKKIQGLTPKTINEAYPNLV